MTRTSHKSILKIPTIITTTSTSTTPTTPTKPLPRVRFSPTARLIYIPRHHDGIPFLRRLPRSLKRRRRHPHHSGNCCSLPPAPVSRRRKLGSGLWNLCCSFCYKGRSGGLQSVITDTDTSISSGSSGSRSNRSTNIALKDAAMAVTTATTTTTPLTGGELGACLSRSSSSSSKYSLESVTLFLLDDSDDADDDAPCLEGGDELQRIQWPLRRMASCWELRERMLSCIEEEDEEEW
ncbi:uncharacterized protein BP01DRAFT_361651 [Aspergillus saccharolyticus JOP 1030-1]|uniref:Uncharacterized protein n=1 Tax=Aspergillus saccharolyticus JOP 1030-1 TaxID=1450539 RepID=A0A318ZSI4_9EURO|nr:hypothetical protein BP01DRAFT_361651 [Aspergillus saccharolyticus JOP 1030-1]PYH49604.1 hypothetical protein BP01DRAFT_361651 [Aspergillus saccharolyticus JOP 1030-1]